MRNTFIVGCFLLLLSLQLSAQFQPHADYPTGQSPFGVAVGDFNNDGKLDLAVTNSAGNTVGILLGNGDATLWPRVDYATGTRPTSVVVGDFNHDGKLDLTITNATAGTVSVLLGKGDGTFQPHVDYAAQTNPQFLVAADFNNDGMLDLAAANYGPDYSGGSVSILLGNGDGTFQAQRAYAAGVNPFGIVAGDFNRDGNLDLAVPNNNGGWGVSILLGSGDGSFQSLAWYAAGTNPRQGVATDFNGDGNLDLAIGNCLDSDVSILIGDGQGHFSTPANYAIGSYVQAVAGGDFNRDGKLDLVVTNSGSNSVSVLLSNGDGTFQSHVDYVAGSSPNSVATGDFDGDSYPDIVTANMGGNTVSILASHRATPNFSIAATAMDPAAVALGRSATSTISVTSQNGFNGSVALACSVQPAPALGPQCSLSPASITPGTTATLTVTTSSPSAGPSTARNLPESHQRLFYAIGLPFMGMAVCGLVLSPLRKKRKLMGLVLCSLLVAGTILQAACGGDGNCACSPGTPGGNYTITISGTSGSLAHTTSVTLAVH